MTAQAGFGTLPPHVGMQPIQPTFKHPKSNHKPADWEGVLGLELEQPEDGGVGCKLLLGVDGLEVPADLGKLLPLTSESVLISSDERFSCRNITSFRQISIKQAT